MHWYLAPEINIITIITATFLILEIVTSPLHTPTNIEEE